MTNQYSRGERPHAIVVGGSTSGLLTAALLRKQGWSADVYERSPVELVGRGAGIVCHPDLVTALKASDAGTDDLGVDVKERLAFGDNGDVIARRDFPQTVTSWDRLHQLARKTVPDEHYHLNHHLLRVEPVGEVVRAIFEGGREVTGDLLIGADGFRSVVRTQHFPESVPQYAGYVIWRGLADERDIDVATRNSVFERFTFHFPPQNEVLGYPIAGINNDLRKGRRRYNWVWYRLTSQKELDTMLTDETGLHHPMGMPPPLIRNETIEAMRGDARKFITPPLLEVLRHVERPFFTPIYDLVAPEFAFGRVALVGDAGVVARPHVGYGTSKAAGDALALARLVGAGADIEGSLREYSALRRSFGIKCYERGRQLGSWLTGEEPRNAREKAEAGELHSIEGILRHVASGEFLTVTGSLAA